MIDTLLKMKRKLTNVRVKKYRRKKCTESQPTEEMQNKQVKGRL